MGEFPGRRAKRRGLILAVVVAVCLMGVLVPASARAREVSGTFRSERITPCSPTPICTAGRATGDIEGRFTLTGTSVIPTAQTPTTGVLAYTADVVINTREGTINCKDTGVTKVAGDGAASSICVLASGTGIYQGATGYIQFQSRLIPPATFRGTYVGRISGISGIADGESDGESEDESED